MRYAMAGDGGHGLDLGSAVTKFWPVVAGLGMAAWAAIKLLLSGRLAKARETAAALLQRGELITIAQDAAKDVIGMLASENKRLGKRVDDLEVEVTKMQEMHVEVLRSKEEELTLMRGDLRQAMSLLASYERLLTEHAIPHDKPSQPYWEMDRGQLRALGAPPVDGKEIRE